MGYNPTSADNLISILAQGYFQQSLAYEDLLEVTEKKLELYQEQDISRKDVKIKLAGMEAERVRLLGHIAKMNESLEKVKNQLAAAMGVADLSYDLLLQEAKGQSTAELEKILSHIGQLIGRMKAAEEYIQRIDPKA
jgi:hypothetical protein